MQTLARLIMAGLFALCLVGFSLVFKSDLISKNEAWKVFLGITFVAFVLILIGDNRVG